jgi:hypothetical protein
MVFPPDSWGVAATDGVPRDKCCFANDERAWNTCPLLIVLYNILSVGCPCA